MALPEEKTSEEFAACGPFTWRVYGYRLRRMLPVLPETGSRREDVLILQRQSDSRVYRPIADFPDLFTKFSEIADAKGVLRFAEEFGHLGETSYFIPNALQSHECELGESVPRWLHQADSMARALDLWDKIQRNEGLAKVIEWVPDGVLYRPRPFFVEKVATKTDLP
jgi:hypothetical protein